MTTEEKVKEVLANKVSPALQMHGGDCSFVKYGRADWDALRRHAGRLRHLSVRA